MTSISAQDLFKLEELPSDAELSSTELRSAFWQLKKTQREFQQQQTFWRSVNDSMSDAYAKLASFQEELRASQEELREANSLLEEKVRQRTHALNEARELAENVVASISDMLLIVDVDGKIQQANRAAEDLLGSSEKELIGRQIQSILSSDLDSSDLDHAPDLTTDWLSVVLREGEIRNHDAAYLTRANQPLPVVFSASRLRSPNGAVLGIVCIAKDVTERRQAERDLRAQLEQITSQEEMIRALFTPIIRVWERVLVLPIIGDLDPRRVDEIMHDLLHAVVDSRSAFVVLDLTGVQAVDGETAHHLIRINHTVRLLGTECLLSGISPSVAQSILAQDVDLRDLVSFSTLHAALAHALMRMGELPGPSKGHLARG
jgi:PAS domain S-box-containing protein